VDQAILRSIFDRLDGVLLAGGGDVDPVFYNEKANSTVYGIDRELDEIEMRLVRWSVAEGKPIFAICRGIQVMNVALGGSLFQDISSDKPDAIRHGYFQNQGFARDYPAHEVRLIADSRLAGGMGGDRFIVNSLHHQGIKELAPELTSVGYAPDGLIEAAEVENHVFAVGVQWHPESLAPSDPAMRRLFEDLVEAAQNGRERYP
jgi:putative glutamine amidotransferase